MGKIGYFDLYAIQVPPSSILDTPPEIDFVDVSDDLDQKKKYVFLGTKKFFGLVKFFKKNNFFKKMFETSPQG